MNDEEGCSDHTKSIVTLLPIPPQDSPITNLRIDPLTQEGDITIESIRLLR